MTDIFKAGEFNHLYFQLLKAMRDASKVPQSSWQSQQVFDKPGMKYSRELTNVIIERQTALSLEDTQNQIRPSLPWAEDHFLERISGEPLNPPPSEEWWPYAQQGNSSHKTERDGKFSHTYPERFWATHIRCPQPGYEGDPHIPMMGIRYEYGNLNDVIRMIGRDPLTRQAYLPIWFPEDTGATKGQRVPCTLGYHFLFRHGADGKLYGDITYFMRSCDLLRHFRDDVYMAERLLQFVVRKLRDTGIDAHGRSLIMHISSLHTFEGDELIVQQHIRQYIREQDEEIYGTAI